MPIKNLWQGKLKYEIKWGFCDIVTIQGVAANAFFQHSINYHLDFSNVLIYNSHLPHQQCPTVRDDGSSREFLVGKGQLQDNFPIGHDFSVTLLHTQTVWNNPTAQAVNVQHSQNMDKDVKTMTRVHGIQREAVPLILSTRKISPAQNLEVFIFLPSPDMRHREAQKRISSLFLATCLCTHYQDAALCKQKYMQYSPPHDQIARE